MCRRLQSRINTMSARRQELKTGSCGGVFRALRWSRNLTCETAFNATIEPGRIHRIRPGTRPKPSTPRAPQPGPPVRRRGVASPPARRTRRGPLRCAGQTSPCKPPRSSARFPSWDPKCAPVNVGAKHGALTRPAAPSRPRTSPCRTRNTPRAACRACTVRQRKAPRPKAASPRRRARSPPGWPAIRYSR